ncbi:hypothetical protein [Aestuariimicrobium kwangyangense]|uniref:hypothetical protein n=1 Tax=Aestuariimicrobium kwangyangense TaxID=396389 RepID=UPI0003B67CAC|nr:hypothetical protein [Aestuariimicrobium kwangyangense]
MAALSRSRLATTAMWLLGLAAVLLVVSVIPGPEMVRASVYTVAFWVALGGLGVLLADRLHVRRERPTLLPVTSLGWWSLGLMVAGVLVFVVMGLSSRGGRGPGIPLFVFTVTAFTAMAAAGVMALAAWVKRRERSLLVALAIVPALFAIYFVAGEFAFPH